MKNIEALPLNKENFKDLFSLNFLTILVISFPSAIVAEYFKIPLSWMLGPMLTISVATLSGLKLKKRFRKVSIAKTNQEIVNKCNWIFLAVTPKVGEKIIPKLKFRSNQKIISFISTIDLAHLKKFIRKKLQLLELYLCHLSQLVKVPYRFIHLINK